MEGDGDPACTEDRPQRLRSVLKVDESNLTPKQRKELQEELATEFADVFTFDSQIGIYKSGTICYTYTPVIILLFISQ